jgi:hypothetical protein
MDDIINKTNRISLREEGSVDIPVLLLQLHGLNDCNDADDGN